MLVGLLSDSHGKAEITARAVRTLIDRGATCLFHMGDLCGQAVVDALVVVDDDGKHVPVHVVFGNCDFDVVSMRRYAQAMGIVVDHPAGVVTFDGKTIGFTHGHEMGKVAMLLEKQVDYLCLGHSHEVRDERIGPTRVLNPGALFRAAQFTVALLDTAEDRVEWIGIV